MMYIRLEKNQNGNHYGINYTLSKMTKQNDLSNIDFMYVNDDIEYYYTNDKRLYGRGLKEYFGIENDTLNYYDELKEISLYYPNEDLQILNSFKLSNLISSIKYIQSNMVFPINNDRNYINVDRYLSQKKYIKNLSFETKYKIRDESLIFQKSDMINYNNSDIDFIMRKGKLDGNYIEFQVLNTKENGEIIIRDSNNIASENVINTEQYGIFDNSIKIYKINSNNNTLLKMLSSNGISEQYYNNKRIIKSNVENSYALFNGYSMKNMVKGYKIRVNDVNSKITFGIVLSSLDYNFANMKYAIDCNNGNMHIYENNILRLQNSFEIKKHDELKILWNDALLWKRYGRQVYSEINSTPGFKGKSVSINDDGTVMVVGEPWNSETGTNRGAIRIYNYGNVLEKYDGRAYSGIPDETLLKNQYNLTYALNYLKDNEQYKGMHYSTTSPGYYFYKSEPIMGDTIDNYSNFTLYTKNVDKNDWVLKDTIYGEYDDYQIGWKVRISSNGKVILVSGNIKYNKYSGVVCIYRYENGIWNKKTISGLPLWSYWFIGHSISISSDGTIIAISSIFTDPYKWEFVWGSGWVVKRFGSDMGTTYIYRWNKETNEYNQLGQQIIGEFSNDMNGASIQLSHDGNSLIIASARNDDGGNDKGSVRVYKWREYTLEDEENETYHYSGMVQNSLQTKPIIITSYANYRYYGNYKPSVGNKYWTQVGAIYMNILICLKNKKSYRYTKCINKW